MKKVLAVVLGCLFLATGFAYAGHRGGSEHDGKDRAKIIEKHMAKLKKKLDLNAEQEKQVRAALEAKWEKADAVHQEMRQKMEPIHEEYKKTMDSILDAKQREKLAAFREKWEKKHHRADGDDDDCCGDEPCPMKDKK